MYGQDVVSETSLNGNDADNFYANSPASDLFKGGPVFGIGADYRWNRYFASGLYASYIAKGAKINAAKHWNHELGAYEDVNGNIYWHQNFWTLEIPFTGYIPHKNNDIFLKSGIFAGFLIKSEEKGKIEISGREYEYTNERHANSSEPGYFLGAGYLFSLPDKKGAISGEVLWQQSVIKSPGSGMVPRSLWYFNQAVIISFAYTFAIR